MKLKRIVRYTLETTDAEADMLKNFFAFAEDLQYLVDGARWKGNTLTITGEDASNIESWFDNNAENELLQNNSAANQLYCSLVFIDDDVSDCEI